MRVAWFRPRTIDHADPFDDTHALITALRTAGHHLDVITAPLAHEFVWQHARRPYDASVFELDDDKEYTYVWPYLMHFGGVVFLRRLTLHDSRATRLSLENRPGDYEAEFRFSEGNVLPHGAMNWLHARWPMLRVPVEAASMVVMPFMGVAGELQRQYPGKRIGYAPIAVAPVDRSAVTAASGNVTFGLLSRDDRPPIRNAMARAVDTGSRVTLVVADDPLTLAARADVVLSLQWPWEGAPLFDAVTAMAAAKPVVALETRGTADWPALDPQTWQPRALSDADPIAVTIDTRQEEHRLLLTFRRLAADAAMRERLGNAAFAWWQSHVSPGAAAAAWERVLFEAAAMQPPGRPDGWPDHLDADGSERARALLGEMDVSVDFFDDRAR